MNVQWGYSSGMAIDSQCKIRTTVEKTQHLYQFSYIIHYLHIIVLIAIEEKAIHNVIQIFIFVILDVFVLTMSSF